MSITRTAITQDWSTAPVGTVDRGLLDRRYWYVDTGGPDQRWNISGPFSPAEVDDIGTSYDDRWSWIDAGDLHRWYSIEQVVAANAAAGRHFFDRDTIRYFGSRIGRRLYCGCLFVTSEMGPFGAPPRAYTVRLVRRDATIDTIGTFREFATAGAAHRAAARIAAELDELDESWREAELDDRQRRHDKWADETFA